MIRNIALICIIMMMVFAVGCSQENTDQEAAQDTPPAVQEEEIIQLTAAQQETVDKAVAIAKAFEEAPDAVAGVLAEYSMSEEDFNTLFYEIAASPAMSTAYQEALAK